MKCFRWIPLLALAFVPISMSAQTVDELIAKNIQARGGLEKLHAIKSFQLTGKILQGPMRVAYVQKNKRESKIREESVVQGLTQVRAFDGSTAWQINPFGGRRDPDLMSHDASKGIRIEADLDGPLVDYKQKGYQAEYLGHDSVEGTDCYKIKLTLKEGDVRYYYLDADSYLEIKIEAQTYIRGALQYRDMMLGDYEQVDGVYFPFSTESGEPGSERVIRLTVDKIELNVPFDDAQFSFPGAKPDAKSASATK